MTNDGGRFYKDVKIWLFLQVFGVDVHVMTIRCFPNESKKNKNVKSSSSD